MKRTIFAALSVAALSTACLPAYEGEELAQFLPDDRLLINMPTDVDGAKEEREWSEMYLLTAQVTDDVNGLISVVLVWVNVITEFPPTELSEDGNTAVWGPWSDSLDPVETTLTLDHDLETDVYTWAFSQRAKGVEDAEFVPVIAGEIDPAATHEVHSGRFWVDFDLIHEMDPTSATGLFGTEYAVDEAGVEAVAVFDDFADGGEPVDAAYAYTQQHGGPGSMDLLWTADADAEEQIFLVRSRWLEDGQGRSDAIVAGGGEGAAALSECWGADFAPVYQANTWEGLVYGEEAECAFEAAEYPQEEPSAE